MAEATKPAGEPIRCVNGQARRFPDHPIIPFIEGDGTGRTSGAPARRVFDAAVEKAYGGKRKIAWKEVLAGEKAFNQTGHWLPDETVAAFRDYLVGIKGPLTTPVGGGIRSLNVALRQTLDLYVCLRPVRYFSGVPSPVSIPSDVDMVIFRENTEDIYAGIEWAAESPEAQASDRVSAERDGREEDPLPRDQRHRHQARVARRHRTPGARRHPVRPAQTSARASPWCTRATS